MFRNQSITRKLMAVILLTSAAVLVLACGTFFTYELLTFRRTMARGLSTIGQVVAMNSTAALAFENPTDATEVLSALSADRHIIAAGLYDKAGTLFARYPDTAADDRVPARIERDGSRFTRAFLVLQEPVVNADRRLGTLVLKADLSAMYERLVLYATLALVAIVLSGLVAWPLSHRLQRQISEPVQALADTAKAVAEEKDYSVRAARFADDELGSLTDVFNGMLATIQGHDRALRDHTDALEIANERLQGAISQRRQAEAMRDRLAAVVEYSYDAIISKTLDGIIQSWNEGATRLFGYTPAEAIGQSMTLLIPADRLDEEHAIVARLRRGERISHFETRRRKKDGTIIDVSLTISPIKDDEGRIVGASKIVRDISESKRAEEALRVSQQRLTLALEAAQVGHWELDLVTGTARRSPLHDRIFGYPALLPNWSYETFLQHVHPDDRARVDKSFQAGAAAGDWDFECRIIRADQAIRWIWARGNVLRNSQEQQVLMLGLVADITERKRAEEEIRRLNVDLERRVEERTAQLEQANQELESFSYSVSHDLRAPLRHVHGYAEMLQQATNGQLPEKAHRYLNTILAASVEMGQLIDDLLAFARMGRAEMRESCVHLDDVVRQTIHGLELATAGRNIVWQVAPLPPVIGDPALVGQVLANLIGNAVKYSRQRDPARIEIGCAGEEEGKVILFVRDNGAGFDMQYSHKLFGVFQRLHRAEEFEGTGVGLATVRRIVARHGGRVWAKGAVDEGATFYFTLQRSPSA